MVNEGGAACEGDERERASPVRGWTITYSRALGSGAPDLAITTISFLKQPQRGTDTGCQ